MKRHMILFGSSGMLGSYVHKYFFNKFKVFPIDRGVLDISNATEEDIADLLPQFDDSVVVNCAGVIKPRVKELGEIATIKVNSVFPWMLSKVCNDLWSGSANLIHITTDCVFSGVLLSSYNEDSFHDCKDLYGTSKSLGEPKDCTVIRTSIIGEEKNNSRSLIEWAKSQKGKTVDGYSNHHWNGITCLQFCKIIEKIINSGCYWRGVRHIFSPNIVSKYQLVKDISEVYDLKLNINKVDAPQFCFRNLETLVDWPGKPFEYFNIPLIRKQIEEMKDFSLNGTDDVK